MRTIVTACLLAGAAGAITTFAQQPAAPPAMTLFASSADVTALIAKAKVERRPDQANFIQPILQLAPYRANLEYRAGVGPAAAHDREAEMFYVIEGGGTLVTGGTLVMETRTNANNRNGTAIQGGETRRVAKGDFFIVPEGTPHWFSAVDGTLVMMSLHVPRGAQP
jgi:mannose-6-phosphate isomerase-like protein (cupin superfamily)